jgi:hypothetical protein
LEGAKEISWERLRNERMNEGKKEWALIFCVEDILYINSRRCKTMLWEFSFINYIYISTHPDWHCTLALLLLLLFLLLLLLLPLLVVVVVLLVLLLLLSLLYYCNPSLSIQLFSVINHVGQVGKTWKNYVTYDGVKDKRIMFTLTFNISD